MAKLILKKQIEAYRDRKWRRGKLRTIEDASGFLDDVGMCLLFACRDIALPKIHECAAGGAQWWPWKDRLQERKYAYNGRLVRRKATLVSMELLPAFYAIYRTGGGYAMYEEEYYWGKLGELANRVAEHIDNNGPVAVDVLRKAVVPGDKKSTRRFHAALFELQSKFKIVTVGLIDRSWGIRILDLFVNWVPPEVERRAEKMSRSDAMELIAGAFIDTAGAAAEVTLARLFGWSASETTEAVSALVASGRIERGRLRGDERTWLVSAHL